MNDYIFSSRASLYNHTFMKALVLTDTWKKVLKSGLTEQGQKNAYPRPGEIKKFL